MRLTDLRHKLVRGLDGEHLGRVFEVHCERGRITALMVGPGSLLERMTAKRAGRRIPWEMVRRINSKEIIVAPDPPQRKLSGKPSRPNASRSPQRTRRPSERRSRH